MPSRKILFRCGALLCAALIFSIAVQAHAQTKFYNINLAPSAANAPVAVPAAPIAAPIPAPAQTAVAPVQSAFAPAPSGGWIGQPLGNLSQPPLLINQPAAFAAPQPVPVA